MLHVPRFVAARPAVVLMSEIAPRHASQERYWAATGSICSILFGLRHFYWAVGGTIGAAEDIGDIHDRPWFLAYDIAAGAIFVAVGVGAALLGAEAGTHRLRSRLVTACWWGGGLALLRGGAALVQDAIMVDDIDIGALYDGFFAVGGLIFLQTARLLRPFYRADSQESGAVDHRPISN